MLDRRDQPGYRRQAVTEAHGERIEKEDHSSTVTFDVRLTAPPRCRDLASRWRAVAQVVTRRRRRRPPAARRSDCRCRVRSTWTACTAYVIYDVPDLAAACTGIIRERTYTATTRTKPLASTEPRTCARSLRRPRLRTVKGRREDAESINRSIDDHGYLRRAASIGAKANSSIRSATPSAPTRRTARLRRAPTRRAPAA